MGVNHFEPILCLVGARKIKFIFLNSMGPQLSNAHSIIKIGQKLTSVRIFKVRTRTPNMTPLWKFSREGSNKKLTPNFKISYRSEFLFNFKNKISSRKLRLHTFQKYWHFFSCVHFARRMTKIWGLTILTLVCAWWVHVK